VNQHCTLSIANASDTATTLYNDGTLWLAGAAGSSAAGDLTVTGNYGGGTQQYTVLDIGLGGAGAGSQYGQLDVSGTATLVGTLDVSLSNGFVPYPGETFDIVTAGSRSGTFQTTEFPTGLSNPWLINYTSNGVVLEYVPEPASAAILALAAVNLLRRRRRAM
jgi:hypothetical protein